MLSLPFETDRDQEPRLRAVVNEVYALLVERGTLTRAEIQALFALADDNYRDLQNQLLKMPRVSGRPGSNGGFILNDARSVGSENDSDDGEPNLSGPERRAVARLLELLNARMLAELVGDELRGTLRSIRRIQSGRRVDRPLRQRELAIALVVKERLELLANRQIRQRRRP